MKKISFLLSIAAVIALVSCNGGAYKEKAEQDSLKILQLTSDYEEAATFNDSLMLLMADIYNGLDSINMQEGLLYNMGNGENTNRRAEVRRNLSAIKARLATNKALLEQMENKLKDSGSKNAFLSKTIEEMKTRLEKQDSHILVLESRLAAAHDTIGILKQVVAETQEQVQIQTESRDAAWAAYEEADSQLNTVYYAMGTKKELKQNGLIEKKFLGATKVLKGDFNESYFTKADKRNLTSIPTGAKKIKIMTNMPKGSYTEVVGADKTITLQIDNPQEFWSLTPYLIIELN